MFFHILILLLLSVILTLMIIGYIQGKAQIDAAVTQIHGISDKLNRVDWPSVTANVNALSAKVSTICGKNLPVIGHLC